MVVQMLTSAVAISAGPTHQMLRGGTFGRVSQGVFQVGGITTATVKLQGRASATAPWVDVVTLTADGAQAVQLMYQMQAIVSAYTSGTINAWMDI